MEYLPFERPIAVLRRARDGSARGGRSGRSRHVRRARAAAARRSLLAADPWQRTQVARHPDRPHFRHLVEGLFEEFLPLGGDRAFGDDQRSWAGSRGWRGGGWW
jgi:acetyl-CoA carboxylase carboxyl transferase subunit alpha